MARSLCRSVVILATAMAGVAGFAPAGWADTGATGHDFGQHVVMCAQAMGSGGDHNPGINMGFAGWTPAHTC
jgi:hypothetical protein